MNTRNQLCTFTVGNFFFGLGVEQVQEVIRYQKLTRVPLASPTVRGLINLRGQIVTAIDMRSLLKQGEYVADETPMNVIVRNGDSTVSFLVDKIGDVLEMDENDFELPPETLKGVARILINGAYKLPGQLLLALDVEKMIELTIENE